MSRNFGIQSGARDPGGVGISRSAYSADTRADLNSLDAAELASKCFFFGVLTLIGFVLFVSWFVISNFVA